MFMSSVISRTETEQIDKLRKNFSFYAADRFRFSPDGSERSLPLQTTLLCSRS